MLDGRRPFFDLTCDFCCYSETIEADSFMEAVEQKKERGWKSVNDGGWKDKCPSCCEQADDGFFQF